MSRPTLCSILVSTVLLAGAAAAQSYPEKAVRVVVPFPPGGAADWGKVVKAAGVKGE